LVLSKIKGLTLSSWPVQSIGLVTVSGQVEDSGMDEEDMRYRVSAVVTSTLQIVVQARSVEEAEAFSDAIDFDKWSLVSSEYVTVDVAKDFFEIKQKVQQDIDISSDTTSRPILKIIKG
jgi:hypothetical protein